MDTNTVNLSIERYDELTETEKKYKKLVAQKESDFVRIDWSDYMYSFYTKDEHVIKQDKEIERLQEKIIELGKRPKKCILF